MSDLFGAPPAPPKRQRRLAGDAGRPPISRPSTEPQAMQAGQALPPGPTCTGSQAPPAAPRLYGQVTLHDGRQVDSGSAEWRMECLASTLLQLGESERDEWIRGYGTPAAQVELRLLVRAMKAARRSM